MSGPRLKPTVDGGRRGEASMGFGAYRFEAEPAADGRDCRIVDESGRDVGSFRLDISQPPPAPKRQASTSPPPMRSPACRKPIGPGTWFWHLTRALTLGLVRHGLECERRRRAMDAAGWRGLPKLWWGWARDQARKGDPG